MYRIDITIESDKGRTFGERNETIRHIINKCSKLTQHDYRISYDSVTCIMHGERCGKDQRRNQVEELLSRIN